MRKNSPGFAQRFCQAPQMLIDEGKRAWEKTEGSKSGERRGVEVKGKVIYKK